MAGKMVRQEEMESPETKKGGDPKLPRAFKGGAWDIVPKKSRQEEDKYIHLTGIRTFYQALFDSAKEVKRAANAPPVGATYEEKVQWHAAQTEKIKSIRKNFGFAEIIARDMDYSLDQKKVDEAVTGLKSAEKILDHIYVTDIRKMANRQK